MEANNNEIEMLKANLCMKDHEIFSLRTELERRNHETQALVLSIERLEKTMATCYDRLLRKMERSYELESRKRRRRD